MESFIGIKLQKGRSKQYISMMYLGLGLAGRKIEKKWSTQPSGRGGTGKY
jgi:hypothetical protein